MSPVLSRWQSFGIILAAAAYVPLLFWSTNLTDLARPWVSVCIYLMVGLVVWFAVNYGLRKWHRPATYLAALLLLLGAGGDAVLSTVGISGFLGLLSILVFIVLKLAHTRLLYLFLSALTIFFVLSPLGNAVEGLINWGSPTVNRQSGLFTGANLDGGSDVFLLVLDAYGGHLALEAEFEFDNHALLHELKQRGFEVPTAWASYPLTYYSIPSLLDMGYVANNETVTSSASEAYLHRMTGGDNQFVSVFRASGYEFTMIEAGWGGSRCGENVDNCVPAPIYSDGLSAIAASSVLGNNLLTQLGSGFTQGSLASMNWIRSNASSLSSNGVRDLVFAHLLVPHPPTFLDSECRVRAPAIYTTFILSSPGDSKAVVEARKAGYLEQVECVNQFIREFVDLVGPDSTIVILGDHGPETLNQLFTDPAYWSERQIVERLNAFLAVRTSESCDLSSPIVLPNVLRAIVGCLSGVREPKLPDRLFIVVELERGAAFHEVTKERVRSLLTAK